MIFCVSSFKSNIEKLAKLVDDVPMKSPEKAAWYIEHVIRNKGAKHLNYPQKEIPFYQYHYYDILLSVFGLLTVFITFTFYIIKITKKLVKRLLNVNWKLNGSKEKKN